MTITPDLPSLRDLLHTLGPISLLTTTTTEGALHSRPMVLQEVDDQGHLWFFTSRLLPWVQALSTHPAVNVAFSGKGEQTYLSISGRGEVTQDPDRAARLWNDSYRMWFPGGLANPDLILLRVVGEHADAWIGDTQYQPALR